VKDPNRPLVLGHFGHSITLPEYRVLTTLTPPRFVLLVAYVAGSFGLTTSLAPIDAAVEREVVGMLEQLLLLLHHQGQHQEQNDGGN
jgi:hypothetical protein